ncbi:MAG: DUF87 domain-containing protein [Erysipelotrichaceae bacterium]|nr:DUF87 domain-containing protein [Erysipelotrichaceae bacterium]
MSVDLSVIKPRQIIGGCMLFVAISLFLGMQEYDGLSFWSGLENVISHTSEILLEGRGTQGGLLGNFLSGLFGSLFDSLGTVLFLILMIVLSILLMGYSSIKEWIQNFPGSQEDDFDHLIQPGSGVEIDAPTGPAEDLDIFREPAKKPAKKVHVPEPIDSAAVQPKVEKNNEPRHYMDYGQRDYQNYSLPKLTLLDDINKTGRSSSNMNAAKSQGKKLIEILNEFGINAQLVQIHIGPSVTKFEIKPELGVRVNRISNLQGDIKMGLAATDIRIEAPIPGKNAVGIEIPNVEKTTVQMKDMMRSIPAKDANKKLLFCLGKDLMGSPVYGQLNKMPHLLIAGATGSGKSVCVNAIISSILMRTRPDEVKLVLIDPKKVEFTPYNDVPHLIAPVITDGEMANKALKVVVAMMDHRYELFGETGVRNIQSYNEYVSKYPEDGLMPLPRIVVIIDELADLMLVAAKEVESSIQRITQLARAAGIHLIVATQRPSVDVITGVIKANIPSRIAFAVSQAVDSRTILDQAGAERLLGNGDMLYLPNGVTSPKRIQGVFIQDEEVNAISAYVKKQAKPQYDDAFIQLKEIASQGGEVSPEAADPLYEEVKSFVIQQQKASTSLIQRRFSVGYARAARLVDILEAEGIIGPANGSKPREVYVQNTLEDAPDYV